MCDTTNHKSYGSILTAVNKFGKRIVSIWQYNCSILPMFIQYNAARGSEAAGMIHSYL